MRDYLKHYRVKICVLSPVYIGSGEKIGKKEHIYMPWNHHVIIPNVEKMYMDLQKKSDRYMLLSVALPADEELENAMENASYLLEKRSGFVASSDYAEEWRKKKDLYVFTAGSCFVNCFAGDIYDVSEGGKHPVYRYAKPIFMGVSL